MSSKKWIREMQLCDLEQVLLIDDKSNRDGWDCKTYTEALNTPQMYCRVLENNEEILGFIVCRWYFTFSHVMNLCVKYKTQGDGYLLMSKMIEDCLTSGYIKYTGGEVRVSNVANRNLSYKFGAVDHKIVPNFYGDEDAVFIKKVL